MPAAVPVPGTSSGDAAAGQGQATAAITTPFALQTTEEQPSVPRRELRADLSVEQLLEFLAGADQDMQTIVTGRSGITDPQQARQTLLQIVQMKLEASRRLSTRADASPEARSEGQRGQLQAMSHLASLGDLKAAKELQALAEANLESSDPNLIADSRLVLVGFAMESLQNGELQAAERIVLHLDQIAQAESKPDVAAMMVMGEARHVLASYGHDAEAQHVREMIIALFADAADPEVAEMAARLAGNVRYEAIEQLRDSVLDGQSVAVSRWQEAVQTLFAESADLQTVEYLAGAALEFESIGQAELSAATYAALSEQFPDSGSATGREVQLAIAASRARREVIGTPFDPQLPSADGAPLSMADFRGRVVLMPLWATGFPESLQLVPRLKSLQATHGDKVSIVGINLDAAEDAVQEFLKANELGFPSFRAATTPTAEVANPIAARFGMVSMPFTAIVDQSGRVAAIDFTGRNLEQTVQELLAP
jgi:hypothetical protein